jgi:hypothetical protein
MVVLLVLEISRLTFITRGSAKDGITYRGPWSMNRKEAIAEYKNRKIPRGTFSLRFTENGPVWVDATPDLYAAKNGLLFTLRNGLHRNKELQAEWNKHGETAFRYEILERLEDDVAPMALTDILKDKKKEWLAKLSAQAVTP